MASNHERRLRLIEGRMSKLRGNGDTETRAALATLTDAELDALERAHVTGIDDETRAILEKMERFKQQARAAK
jgi:glucose-6-phosphate isomerase